MEITSPNLASAPTNSEPSSSQSTFSQKRKANAEHGFAELDKDQALASKMALMKEKGKKARNGNDVKTSTIFTNNAIPHNQQPITDIQNAHLNTALGEQTSATIHLTKDFSHTPALVSKNSDAARERSTNRPATLEAKRDPKNRIRNMNQLAWTTPTEGNATELCKQEKTSNDFETLTAPIARPSNKTGGMVPSRLYDDIDEFAAFQDSDGYSTDSTIATNEEDIDDNFVSNRTESDNPRRTRSTSRAKASLKAKTLAPIPADPPVAAFKAPIPPKVYPWTAACPAPTRTYNEPIPCPIDWDYIRRHCEGLGDINIQAYEFRAPWNPESTQMTWAAVLKAVEHTGDKDVNHEESVRKRYYKANLKVFEVTGVYFENNYHGLDSYDIEYEKVKGPVLLRFANQKSRKELRFGNTLTFILHPPTDVDDRCKKCCEENACYDKACREDECCDICCWSGRHCRECAILGYHQDDCDEYYCGDNVCRCPCNHRPNPTEPQHSRDRWHKVLQLKKAPFGCPIHEPVHVRVVEEELLKNVSLRKQFNEITILRIERKAFDVYTSIFAPRMRNYIPKHLKVLRRNVSKTQKLESLIYMNGGDNYSLGDILKAYCCSQALQCPSISDIILEKLASIFYDEDSRFQVLDFTPRDIEFIYQNTHPNDPIRLLLLDIVSCKGEEGRKKIEMGQGSNIELNMRLWHPEFLKSWKVRERERKRLQLATPELYQDMKSKLRQVTKNRADQSVLDSIVNRIVAILQEDLETTSRQIDELSARIAVEPVRLGLIGDFDQVAYPEDHEPQEYTIWGSIHFRGWLPEEAAFPNGHSTYYRGSSIPTTAKSTAELDTFFNRMQTTEALLSKDKTQFCAAYHNHNHDSHNDHLSRRCSRKPFATAPIPLFHRNSWARSHLEVSFRGLVYRVEDFTGGVYPDDKIETMVRDFPEWDWTRVWGVNCRIDVSGGVENVKPTPLYYGGEEADGAGRFPGHPRYGEAVKCV